jgi:hypothetical protein
MKPKDRKVRRGGQEVLSNFPNIKNMGWLMADAVESIYALEDESE